MKAIDWSKILNNEQMDKLQEMTEGKNFFDEEYGDDGKNEDEFLVWDDSVPFREILPVNDSIKRKISLREKIEKIENEGMVTSGQLYPLQHMIAFLSDIRSIVYEASGDERLVDRHYLLEKIQKKDISKLSPELQLLFGECISYLKGLES